MKLRLACVVMASVSGLLISNAWADGVPGTYVADAHAGRCMGGNFSGAYVGGAVGFASHRSEVTAIDPAGGSVRDRDTSFMFGGYAGFNLQCDRVVLGIETDINWVDTSISSVDGASLVRSQLDWFGTLRGRLGYVVHDSLLIYGTAGLAYGKADHRLDDTVQDIAFSQSNGDTKTGWTVGGGLEYLHDSRWLIRAEALYVDLSDTARTYTVAGSDCPGGPCTLRLGWDDDFWVGRIGLTYKFGAREEFVPLK